MALALGKCGEVRIPWAEAGVMRSKGADHPLQGAGLLVRGCIAPLECSNRLGIGFGVIRPFQGILMR